MIRASLSFVVFALLSTGGIAAEFRYGAFVSVHFSDGGVSADGTIDANKLWAVGAPFRMNTRGFVLDGRLVAKSATGSMPLGEFNCGVGDIVAGLDQTYNIGTSCNVSSIAKLPAGSKLYAETGFRLAQDTANQQRTSTLLLNIQLRPVAGHSDCNAIPKPGARKVKGQFLEVHGFFLPTMTDDDTNGWRRLCMLVTARGAGVNQPNVFGALYAGTGSKRSWIGSFRCEVSGKEILPVDGTLANSLHSCNYSPKPLANLPMGTKVYAKIGVTFDQRSVHYTQMHLVKPYPNGLK